MIEPTKNKDLNSQHEDLEGILSTGMRTTTYIEYWVVQWGGHKTNRNAERIKIWWGRKKDMINDMIYDMTVSKKGGSPNF